MKRNRIDIINMNERVITWYEELKSIECQSAAQEECRILYVAMTRAIETLICIVARFQGASMLGKIDRRSGCGYE